MWFDVVVVAVVEPAVSLSPSSFSSSFGSSWWLDASFQLRRWLFSFVSSWSSLPWREGNHPSEFPPPPRPVVSCCSGSDLTPTKKKRKNYHKK